jgi:polysaccharide pyruvyl transferase WcaK-like protein
VRIVVDQSGYALLNLGDIAMLQACVRRLQDHWPTAQIQVVTDSPERLEQYCPGLTAVAPTIVGRWTVPTAPVLPTAPVKPTQVSAISQLTRLKPRSAEGLLSLDSSRLQALRGADLVVSSGGGFLNDVFWRHGAKVLTFLAIAQYLGKPTAMFGQGVGPLTHPVLSRLARHTMPRLLIVGLREGIGSAPLLESCGVDGGRVLITGDDALQLAAKPQRPPTGNAIGLNIRVAFYSGIGAAGGDEAVAITSDAADRRGVTTLALPVSRYRGSSDLEAIHAQSDGQGGQQQVESDDIRSPEELVERAARCRVVVTGSYHAAVFGLAAGVPAVCVTNSRYYDLKFDGLSAQFPGGCHIVRPGPHFGRDLQDAIDRAWDTSESSRDKLHSAAHAQIAQADHAYARFKAEVDARVGRVR